MCIRILLGHKGLEFVVCFKEMCFFNWIKGYKVLRGFAGLLGVMGLIGFRVSGLG